jgi:tetratricopeptide (TPR) repeat protein
MVMDTLRKLRVFVTVTVATAAFAGCEGKVQPLPLGYGPAMDRLEGFSIRHLMVVGAASLEVANRHPNWFPSSELFGGKSALRMYALAAQNVALFRQMHRQIGFDAVWISGDLGTSGPLFDGLVTDSEWVPLYVDHQGVVFRRGVTAKDLPLEVGPGSQRGLSRNGTARVKAAVAANLSALRRDSEARQMIREAREASPGEVDVRVAEARLELDGGRWEAALVAASDALSTRRNYVPALAVKARALYALGRFADAFGCSRKLVERAGGDPLVLFNHAKIAHELRVFGEEIETLKTLIDVVERDGGWTSGYRIYLGQAYAAIGEGDLAFGELNAVSGDSGLSADQKAFVQEALEKLKSR